ncbi:hypothetical protein TNCV_3026931 [Trichonephila clavipes]|nr:hypothetical protein TNCV_3026931 [Trichonephila clavipes]
MFYLEGEGKCQNFPCHVVSWKSRQSPDLFSKFNTEANFRLLSSGVRPHSISQIWLSVEETAPMMILDALYWTIFSFDEEDAEAHICDAYSRTGVTIVV